MGFNNLTASDLNKSLKTNIKGGSNLPTRGVNIKTSEEIKVEDIAITPKDS